MILGIQLYGIVACAAWSTFGSYALLKGIDLIVGLRVSQGAEDIGLDASLHGERMYTIPAASVGIIAPPNLEVTISAAPF